MHNPILALVLTALLAGCLHPIEAMPQSEVDKAVALWQARGLPYSDTCEAQRELIIVRVSDDPCPRSGSEACFTYTDRGTVPTIFVASATEREPAYIWQHELKHWLGMCSGLNRGDPSHSDPTVWPELH